MRLRIARIRPNYVVRFAVEECCRDLHTVGLAV